MLFGRLEIVEIAPGIWRARAGSRGSAAYIVKTSPGAVLIDTGPDATGAPVMQAFQKARVGLLSTRVILLTSGERELAAAAAALRERCGARVLSSPEASAELHPFEPDGFLQPGEVVEKHFEAVAAPEGRLAFLFRPNRALFIGNTPREAFERLGAAVELLLPARGEAVNAARAR